MATVLAALVFLAAVFFGARVLVTLAALALVGAPAAAPPLPTAVAWMLRL